MSYLFLILNVIIGIGLLSLGYAYYRSSLKMEQLRKSSAEKERLSSELQLASQIQRNMMPIGHYVQDSVDIFGSLIPAREMGGDLFDYKIRDEKLFFCIGDVCGKGAPAAMLMAYAHSLLWGLTHNENNPARIVESLNKVASHNNESCTFFTLFYGVLDLPTGRLHYCNAAHNPPYILSDDVMMLDCDPNQPVGPLEDAEFTLQTIMLAPGSTIFLYTDGLTEANNKEGRELGPERAEAVLKKCIEQQLKPEEIVNTVTDAVHQFTMGAEQYDDLTMLAVRYMPQQFESTLSETITLKNDIREITRFGSFQDSVYAKMNIEKSLAIRLRLAVEEAVANAIEHAYLKGREGNVEVKMMTDGHLLKVQIIDSGVAFDPTTVAKADTTLSAKERRLGGLGVLLVRELMDSINYERIDNQNVLTLSKKID
jgi:sigma-B regulation protein RsbU (phosphoserine phosphatase)